MIFVRLISTFASLLWRREATPADRDELDALREGFEASDMRVKHLLAAITETEAYKAGGAHPDTSEAGAGRDRALRLLAPVALGTSTSLTFRSTFDTG